MNDLREHPLSGKNDMDSAFSSTWSFYKKWFPTLYAISFVMALITAIVSAKVDISGLQATADIAELMILFKSMMGVYTVIMLISLFFNTTMQYYIIYKPIDPDFNLIDAAGKVLAKFYLPLLLLFVILGIFSVIAFIFGALMFIVGMLFVLPYVMLYFSMATPLMMIEGTSITDTIQRLFKLVHKKFWPNMGWISVYLLLIIFFSIIISTLIMVPFSGSMVSSMFNPEAATEVLAISQKPSFIVLTALTSALTTPFLPILGLILYFNNSGNEMMDRNHTGSDDSSGSVKVEDLYSKNKNDEFSPTVDDLRP